MSQRLAATCCFLLALVASADLRAQCAERVLVSGYFSNNVHIYDACSGAFERVLDDQGRIRGAQALRVGPDGRLYVVSENNGRILRYDARTLDYIDTFIVTGAGFDPTGVAFGPDGDVYVGGYTADSVRRYDGTTGALEATVVPARAAGLNGPDNGLTFGPDGRLYIPGYDSNSVVVYDPASGSTSGFITGGSGGLRLTRGILFEANGNVLVSGEGNGSILRYGPTGNFIGVFAPGLGAPAGMGYLADGRIVVATTGTTADIVSTSGSLVGPLNGPTSGGLNGATFAIALPKGASVDLSQVGSQYWIVGAGSMSAGRVLELDLVSATGTVFGSAFAPQDVVRKRWGRLRIEFTSCTTANLAWTSSGANSAGFGDFGYPLTLLVPTAFTTACQAQPFAQAQGVDWINGTWFGGGPRDGEGWMINRAPDGTVFVAFFTHRPA